LTSTSIRPSIGVVVNSFKSEKKILELVLKHIIKSKKILLKSIIIVDYGTSSDVLNSILSIRPGLIKVINLNKDPGLLSMRVLGLKNTPNDIDYVAFIDNDVFITKYTLYDLARTLMVNNTLGSISPIIASTDATLQWIGTYVDKSCFVINEIPPLKYIDREKHIIYTAYPLGAVFMMPYETALKTITPCPELRFWYDDFIIGLRLWFLKSPPAITLNTLAYHIGGFTRSKKNIYNIKKYLRKNVFEYYRSRLIACKHIFGSESLLVITPLVLLDILRFNFLPELFGKKNKLTTLYSLLGLLSGIKASSRVHVWLKKHGVEDSLVKNMFRQGLGLHIRFIFTSMGKKYKRLFSLKITKH